ncbi:Unknown protein [Striga hermonthica]|uniref:Uncharacterized protein n=1 Tax=Striga hermonthica TaxID=68872 RepID=A0A9N7RC38_STRHE|nr:Unknown protein [Striga hermonthica]
MVGLNTSQEIWTALEKNFSRHSLARVMQYKMEIQALKKGSLTMKEYISKMKGLFDALAAAGHMISEKDQIMHLIGGLGQEYNPIMVTVSSRVEPWTLLDIQALLLSFESRLESVGATNKPLVNSDGSFPILNAAYTQNSSRGAFQGGFQRSRGRASFNQRGGRQGRGRGMRSRISCQVCGIAGHSAERCWYRYDSTYMGSAPDNANKNFNNNPSLNLAHTPSSASYDLST